MPRILSFSIYPIKSTTGFDLNEVNVQSAGLHGDRRYLLLDAANKMMTARDFPDMLKFRPSFDEKGMKVQYENESLHISDESFDQETYFELWKQGVLGRVAKTEINQWFSDRLGQEYKLVHQSDYKRSIPKKEGAALSGVVTYADQAPILLVSQASVEDVNKKAGGGISAVHFRSNILIDHDIPFAEDNWRRIKIGKVEFDVLEGCKRCLFTTIDPLTFEKHPNQEPLRSLSQYRPHPRGGVSFGIHLVPKNEGMITLEDQLEILE